MKPGVRDFAWVAFAALFGTLSAAGWIIRLTRVVNGDLPLGPGILGLGVGGLVAFWITVGAWRRTTWGVRRHD